MRNTQFNTKEEYLAYRSEWKAEYKELSQQIRDAKFCRWFCSLRKDERIKPNLAHFQKIGHKTDWTPWNIAKLKEKAYYMLEERKASKVRAQEQYTRARLDFEDAQKEQYVEN